MTDTEPKCERSELLRQYPGMTDEQEIMVRLEMLIGHLSDQLAPADALMKGLRLQSNASTTTRGKLDLLFAYVGDLHAQLRIIAGEAKAICRYVNPQS
jgi:hypothetical protein